MKMRYRNTLLLLFVVACQNSAFSQHKEFSLSFIKELKELQDKGDVSEKYNLIFMGDGFTEAQQSMFNDRVDGIKETIFNSTPFNLLRDRFNIWRINIISSQAGISKLSHVIHSPLHCMYGNDKNVPRRCIYADQSGTDSIFKAAETVLPNTTSNYAIIVLVNDPEFGGCEGGNIIYTSLHYQMANIVMHELGHRIARLADEYTFLINEHEDQKPITNYLGSVNLSIEKSWEGLPWYALLTEGTKNKKFPLTSASASPNEIGAFMGGYYSREGIYRSQNECKMSMPGKPFCAVCAALIKQRLLPFVSYSEPGIDYIPAYNIRDSLLVQSFPVLLKMPVLQNYFQPDVVSIDIQGLADASLEARLIDMVTSKPMQLPSFSFIFSDSPGKCYAIRIGKKDGSSGFVDKSVLLKIKVKRNGTPMLLK